jgi:hypothetical protein
MARRREQVYAFDHMLIAKTIAGQLEHASWIRHRFVEDARFKQEHGVPTQTAGRLILIFVKTPISDGIAFGSRCAGEF